MSPQEIVAILNANEHLGHTDWHIGKYSLQVFFGSSFISFDEAVRAAEHYANPQPQPQVQPK